MNEYHYVVFRGQDIVYDGVFAPLAENFEAGDYALQKFVNILTKTRVDTWYINKVFDREHKWINQLETELPKELRLLMLLMT